jgi:hypothetical protein
MNCRMCHREITDPTSVQHGFGPVCWRKLNEIDYDERPTSLRITITDQDKAKKAIAAIQGLMASALDGKRIESTCRKCDELLDPLNIAYYDHEGGYTLPGFGKPQWLYHHCPKCNYDLSLWKLRIPELPELTKDVVDVSCLEHLDGTDAKTFTEIKEAEV